MQVADGVAGVPFEPPCGERQPGKWIAGSDFFRRTRDLDGPAESAGPGEFVHVAAVYAPDGTIAMYRNGEPHGKEYSFTGPVAFEAGDARVLIGLRHGKVGPLAGAVEEARLYDRALTAAEVRASFRAGPDRVSEADVLKTLTPADRNERAVLRKQVADMRPKLAAAVAVPRVTDPWAQALADAAADTGHPLHPWVQLGDRSGPALTAAWNAYAEQWRTEIDARRGFNRANFRPLWDLTREADYAAWTRHGDGLPPRPSPPGEFSVEPAGDRIVSGVYPAGVYTHLLSAKHNGILASPRFPLPANVSVRLMGDRGGGVRVVVDNYPLGTNDTYPQSRPTRDRLMSWVRLDTTYRKGADAYLEVATADDLTRPPPKSPSDGRSLVGVAQVVTHDGKESPKDEIVPVLALLGGESPASREQLAAKIGNTLRTVVTAWRDGAVTDAQAAYLDWFVRRGLLRNTPAEVPAAAPLLAGYRRLEAAVPVPRRAPGVLEAAGRDAPLHVRGNHKTPGPAVPRGFLEALGGRPYRATGTGRQELADDLADPRNPLTARVMVNRLWQWVYGRGLVATPDNLGKLGEPPTHPELLDWLAADFVQHGWSVKRTVRLMVTARAFRTSSRPTDAAAAQDPANAWLTHFHLRRLDAEEVRDGLLAAAGELQPEMYGPPVRNPPLDAGRRSVYLAVVRNGPHPFLEVFDKPPALTTRGHRDVTTLPAQSLALMNSPFVAELTKRWGAKLAARSTEPPADRVRGVFIAALGRPPTDDEVRTATDYLAAAAADHGLPQDKAAADPRPWRDLVHAVVCLKETIYVR